MCRRGMSRTWVGARGAMSRKAMTRSSSWTTVDGHLAGRDPAEQAVRVVAVPPRRSHVLGHQSTGFVLIRNPIVPTRPAIRYDT